MEIRVKRKWKQEREGRRRHAFGVIHLGGFRVVIRSLDMGEREGERRRRKREKNDESTLHMRF
jgi:hypothetical protein